MLSKKLLTHLYIKEGLSMQQIAAQKSCSVNKVKYWLVKHDIERRSISDAVYLKKNPNGDPFQFHKPRNFSEARLFGLGLGLYWGEGTKSNKCSVRLGNTDPELINQFIIFLQTFFQIKKSDLKFGLQLFTDIDMKRALNYWKKKLKVRHSQFYKITITQSGSIGTYRKKSQYGVLTVYYNNTKLRNELIQHIKNLY